MIESDVPNPDEKGIQMSYGVQVQRADVKHFLIAERHSHRRERWQSARCDGFVAIPEGKQETAYRHFSVIAGLFKKDLELVMQMVRPKRCEFDVNHHLEDPERVTRF